MKTPTTVASLVVGASLALTGLAAATTPQAEADEGVTITIVGGRESQTEWPWISYPGGCGGSLVAPRWVVTAAHCLKIKPYKIRVGSNNRWNGGQSVGWTNVYRHPKYGGDEEGYDIGLIELDRALPNATVPIAASARVGDRTRLLGWGATTPEGTHSSTMLKELDTSIVPASRCNYVENGERIGFNAAYELCTDNPGGTSGACFGDSGGPQIKQVGGRWELVGVTSRGPDRCASEASIYTNASAHIPWLRETSRNEIPMPSGWQAPDDPKPTPTPSVEPTTPRPTPTPTPTPSPTTSGSIDPITPPPTSASPQPGGPVKAEFANNTRYDVRDYQTATSRVNVTRSSARNVELIINMDHPCLENLEIAVTPPGGNRTVVKRSSWAWSCTPWKGDKAETYRMNSNPQGEWIIEVTDRMRGNEGALVGWGLTFS